MVEKKNRNQYDSHWLWNSTPLTFYESCISLGIFIMPIQESLIWTVTDSGPNLGGIRNKNIFIIPIQLTYQNKYPKFLTLQKHVAQ